MKAEISVVIPFFNSIEFLQRALESLVRQSLAPKQIIVVDDGSKVDILESLKALCAKYGVLLIHQANAGQSSARNAGIARASTNLVAFLDQDDVMHPEHLESLFRGLDESGIANSVFAYGYARREDLNDYGAATNFYPSFDFANDVAFCDAISKNLNILPSSLLVRRDAVVGIGNFDTSLRGYEDDDLILRLLRQGFRGVYVRKEVSKWMVHSQSSSNQKTMHTSQLNFYKKWKEILAEPSNENNKSIRSLDRRISRALLFRLLASEIGNLDDFGEAQSAAMDFLRISGFKNSFLTLTVSVSSKARLKFVASIFEKIFRLTPWLLPAMARVAIRRRVLG